MRTAAIAALACGALGGCMVGPDYQRPEVATPAAFRFETEPLVSLLSEASERCLDVMIQTLERG